MMLQNDTELQNTRELLHEVQSQIESAKQRPASPENTESLQSLVRTANQLREEIVRYQTARQRQAS